MRPRHAADAVADECVTVDIERHTTKALSFHSCSRMLSERTTGSLVFPFEAALLELVRTILLFVIWWVLFRWLYSKPVKMDSSELVPTPKTHVPDD